MTIEHLQEVPHLTTALTGPLHELEAHLLDHQSEIEAWLRQQWHTSHAPFYASVDLRNAGYKVAPVDTNLFPAGFNNLNPEFTPLCIQAAQTSLERICPEAAKILILPEDHTRNLFYLESIATLRDTLIKAGYEARVGSLNLDIRQTTEFPLPSGNQLELTPVHRIGNRLFAGDYDPCLLLLNNDLSAGIPDILKGIDQIITPPLTLGWSNRLKSVHFDFYSRVAREFAEIVGIDPWFIDPLFRNCGDINFMQREGEECLADNAEQLLSDIRRKYREHGLDTTPYVIVKADAGTYGMGVMAVRSGEELHKLNRKQRTRMSASKGGNPIGKVILQEGVPTYETWGNPPAVAEPVIYMMDRFVVGGFYRVHTKRGAEENLNAPGMHFEPLAFSDSCTMPDSRRAPDALPNRFYTYGVIARLALLAAAREIEARP